MQKQVRMYQAIILLLLGLFLYMFLNMDKNYNDLLEVNDDLIEQLDTNRVNYDSNLEDYQKMYDKLQIDYGSLYVENQQLKKQVESVYNVSKLPVYDYTEAEVYILAQCVQAEAGETNYESQKMITQVILNRLKSEDFPNNLVDVIYQKNSGIQFSVAYDGRLEEQEVTVDTMLNVTETLLYGCDIPDGVQYFYAESLTESNWIKSLKKYKTVEGTVFCYNEKR